jgi:predicted GNAT family acetyltransferase
MSDVQVTDNPAENRFEARLDGELAGIAVYRLDSDRIVFLHTEVDDRFEGHGIGSALARTALDDVRERGGLEVVPQCPFIASWIEKHPDYRDLVAAG